MTQPTYKGADDATEMKTFINPEILRLSGAIVLSTQDAEKYLCIC